MPPLLSGASPNFRHCSRAVPHTSISAALAGADIGTMPYPVFLKLWKHPMTDIGLERFLPDWKKTHK